MENTADDGSQGSPRPNINVNMKALGCALAIFANFLIMAIVAGLIMQTKLKRGGCEQQLALNCSEELVPDPGHLKAEISHEKIAQFYKEISGTRATAGTGNDARDAQLIEEKWKGFGLDDAYTSSYNVLLSYLQRPNEVFLVDNTGSVLFRTSADVDSLSTFVAYSANGTAEGNLVYAHYALPRDFDLLRTMQVNVTGQILLARYGEISVREKALNAQAQGAAGLILYEDPRDFDRFRPGSTTLWSSLKDTSGDPLTPFYPATEYAYREDLQGTGLPQIPVQTVSPDEAEELLRQAISEEQVPLQWQSSLNLILEPGPKPVVKIQMNVRTVNHMASISQVIGSIKGETESKRFVIIGSRRDSCDGGSGTAVLMEIARVLGLLRQTKNWRPRRTIILASWSAGSYGNVGSHEWVENMRRILDKRAVVYLNIDCPSTGQGLRMSGVPSLRRVVREVAASVLNTSQEEVFLSLRTGSDFEPFIYEAGVPYVHFAVATNGKEQPLENVAVAAKVLAELISRFAESKILPFDLEDYAAVMKLEFKAFAHKYQSILEKNGVTLEPCLKNMDFLYDYAKELMLEIKTANLTSLNTDQLRRFNDVLMYFERYFLVHKGFPAKASVKHIVLSPSSPYATSEQLFQPLYAVMEDIGNRTAAEDPEAWKEIRRLFGAVAFIVEQAYISL